MYTPKGGAEHEEDTAVREQGAGGTGSDLILVMRWYNEEIEKERSRQRSSRNGFVWECCQQNIDQLSAEKKAIEEELVG
jgi:hypothetical protein